MKSKLGRSASLNRGARIGDQGPLRRHGIKTRSLRQSTQGCGATAQGLGVAPALSPYMWGQPDRAGVAVPARRDSRIGGRERGATP
jgi:hypothetical protein